jgi:hypothetical protein
MADQRKEVLVMYLFAASDPEFVDNLRFFVSETAATTLYQSIYARRRFL